MCTWLIRCRNATTRGNSQGNQSKKKFRKCGNGAPGRSLRNQRVVVKDQLESLVDQLIERGILYAEAVGEFEEHFIRKVLENNSGNLSKAAKVLRIHRNTLSRKIKNLKPDHRP
jgi:DNA-binding NtrC family response regulator